MKRKVKRYANEGLVEDDDINRAAKVAQKPDVEELKRGVFASKPSEKEPEFNVEEMKRGIAAGKPAEVSSTRSVANKPKAQQATSSRMERGSTAMKRGLATEPPLPSGKETLEAGRAKKDGSGLRSPVDTELARQKAREKIAAHRTQAESERSARKKAQDETLAYRPKLSEYKKGGKTSSASSRGDGIAQRGKTRGKMY